jgi:hypothetical protein
MTSRTQKIVIALTVLVMVALGLWATVSPYWFTPRIATAIMGVYSMMSFVIMLETFSMFWSQANSFDQD